MCYTPTMASRPDLFDSIEKSPLASMLADAGARDLPLVAVNAPFCDLTGYAREAIIGRNARFLQGPGTELDALRQIRQAIAEAQPMLAIITNYRRDGTLFRNGLKIVPVRDERGAVAYFLGSVVDLGPEREAAYFRHGERARIAREKIDDLPRRQREVLRLITYGYRNQQVADELGVVVETVKMHRSRMLARLGVESIAEAIRLGVEAGL